MRRQSAGERHPRCRGPSVSTRTACNRLRPRPGSSKAPFSQLSIQIRNGLLKMPCCFLYGMRVSPGKRRGPSCLLTQAVLTTEVSIIHRKKFVSHVECRPECDAVREQLFQGADTSRSSCTRSATLWSESGNRMYNITARRMNSGLL